MQNLTKNLTLKARLISSNVIFRGLAVLSLVILAVTFGANQNYHGGTDQEIYTECKISGFNDKECSCALSKAQNTGDDNLIGRFSFALVNKQMSQVAVIGKLIENSSYYRGNSNSTQHQQAAKLIATMRNYGLALKNECNVDLSVIAKRTEATDSERHIQMPLYGNVIDKSNTFFCRISGIGYEEDFNLDNNFCTGPTVAGLPCACGKNSPK